MKLSIEDLKKAGFIELTPEMSEFYKHKLKEDVREIQKRIDNKILKALEKARNPKR